MELGNIELGHVWIMLIVIWIQLISINIAVRGSRK